MASPVPLFDPRHRRRRLLQRLWRQSGGGRDGAGGGHQGGGRCLRCCPVNCAGRPASRQNPPHIHTGGACSDRGSAPSPAAQGGGGHRAAGHHAAGRADLCVRRPGAALGGARWAAAAAAAAQCACSCPAARLLRGGEAGTCRSRTCWTVPRPAAQSSTSSSSAGSRPSRTRCSRSGSITRPSPLTRCGRTTRTGTRFTWPARVSRACSRSGTRTSWCGTGYRRCRRVAPSAHRPGAGWSGSDRHTACWQQRGRGRGARGGCACTLWLTKLGTYQL